MTIHKTQQYQQNLTAGIVSISNGKLRLPSHPVQQMPIADTTWKKDLKRYMNSIGMFDNTKESLGDLLEEIHTGKVQLPRSQTQKTQHRKIDCTTSEKEYEQLLFPVSAIFNYAQWREGFQKYWNYDPEKLALARQFELEIIKRFEHYQLPIIQLRPELSKVAVCQIFEDMHEMPTPMTFFDLVTACFAAEDFSLRDRFGSISQQLSRFGVLQGIRNTDWLSAVTLVTTYHRREQVMKENPLLTHFPTVGCGRRNILDLELANYQKFAPMTLAGFEQAAKFLHSLGFVHPEDIAYPSQLLALASALAIVGLPNDIGRTQLEQWWWSCSFGEVYKGFVKLSGSREGVA